MELLRSVYDFLGMPDEELDVVMAKHLGTLRWSAANTPSFPWKLLTVLLKVFFWEATTTAWSLYIIEGPFPKLKNLPRWFTLSHATNGRQMTDSTFRDDWSNALWTGLLFLFSVYMCERVTRSPIPDFKLFEGIMVLSVDGIAIVALMDAFHIYVAACRRNFGFQYRPR